MCFLKCDGSESGAGVRGEEGMARRRLGAAGGENRAVAGVSAYVSSRCGEETGGSVFVTFSVLCFGPCYRHVNPVRWAACGHRSPRDTEPGEHRAGGGAGRSPQRLLALTRHGRREREACLTRTARWRHEEAGLHGWRVQRAVPATPRACPLVGPFAVGLSISGRWHFY